MDQTVKPPASNNLVGLLPDGREVDTWSEEWRAHCEALHVLQIKRRVDRQLYLERVRQKRGVQSSEKLAGDVFALWKLQKLKAAGLG